MSSKLPKELKNICVYNVYTKLLSGIKSNRCKNIVRQIMTRPSLVSVVALVLAVILLFAVLVLYLVYFLNRDITDDYGSEWDYVSVLDTATYIAPEGHQVLAADGGSSNRGNNPDFLFVQKPENVPYEKRIFIVFNTNNNGAQLELRGDGVTLDYGFNTPLFIEAQSGTLFVWKNETTIVPLVNGIPFNS
jgi:hypothetical protein